VQTARPYLQGVNSLEDLQTRIPQAKSEVWSPYQETTDKAGNQPVQGTDGPTTLAALEQVRLQLSASNRGLKTGDPNALQVGIGRLRIVLHENQVRVLERMKRVSKASVTDSCSCDSRLTMAPWRVSSEPVIRSIVGLSSCCSA
jgi:hypothetical protein